MRAPWTALRDAHDGTRQESDERVGHLRLRRERLQLRAVVAVAVLGLLVLGRRPDLLERAGTMPGAFVLIVIMLGAHLVASAVARARYPDPPSPEADRADAVRSLVLLPAGLVFAGVFHWYVGGDLGAALTWLAIFAPVMAVALVVRYLRTARAVREEREDHEP